MDLRAELFSGLNATVAQLAVPILVVAFTVDRHLLWYLKTANVLIRVGQNDSIAWPKVSVLTLSEGGQKKSLWARTEVCLT